VSNVPRCICERERSGEEEEEEEEDEEEQQQEEQEEEQQEEEKGLVMQVLRGGGGADVCTNLKCVRPPKIAIPPMQPAAVVGCPEWIPSTRPAVAPPNIALMGSSLHRMLC
jgi:hypothetical protein